MDHKTCPPGSHRVERSEEMVTFFCAVTGESTIVKRCIALTKVGSRCQQAAWTESLFCRQHQTVIQPRSLCAVCGDRVERDGEIWGHEADHGATDDGSGTCYVCGLSLKVRYGRLGHVWDHPAKPLA